MKIFRSDQIKEIDEHTIRYEPISSIDLMERAAGQLFRWVTEKFERTGRILIFAGPGNNGGDGLALARMLHNSRYHTEVYYIDFTEKRTPDWETNRERLEKETSLKLNYLKTSIGFPPVTAGDIIVDAIFGSGLKRPVDGFPADIIRQINKQESVTISVDIPSGLFGEDNLGNNFDAIVKADYTLCFQFPKLSLMFADNACYFGKWEVLPIGLHIQSIKNSITPYSYIEKSDVAPLLRKRNQFDHKGHFGHGLLVTGSKGMMGASVLAAASALRTGIGLITCHIPLSGNLIMQSAVPEAMVHLDKEDEHITDILNTNSFSAVGLGPGIGTQAETQKAVGKLISEFKKPMVIDADGLNILSLNKSMLDNLPAGTILTPHPKEFERLTGKRFSGYQRLEEQINFSKKYKCFIILKGANTSVSTPDGRVAFNSTGNPGMATAGSGDVLTGIILSLLAQSYRPENASVLGVFLHGLAGDLAALENGYESIIASDIINNIGKAFMNIREIN